MGSTGSPDGSRADAFERITRKLSSNEPLAKLMSGDLRPHFGPFPGLNVGPWNHHAPHSIPKMDSKWDCRSSTQSFASGSNEISAEEFSGGLLVHHHGKACYFVREACFWPFVFKVAGSAENEVSDIEVRLAA